MNKIILLINGSPNKYGTTYKVLNEYGNYLKTKLKYDEIKYIKLPVGLKDCVNCIECNQYCNQKDEFQNILNDVKFCDHIIIGSPVYLDTPTSQTLSFLHRLNCMAENTKREFFKNKNVYIVSTAYCSGTKQVINTIMGACEMLGFNIKGRSSREYIKLWNDKKIRGGLNSFNDSIYITNDSK